MPNHYATTPTDMTKKRLTKAAIEAKIKRSNRKFQAATPPQRRVLIAKDALAQIMAGRFDPVSGLWTDVIRRQGVCDFEPLQPILLQKGTQCKCCGVGSLFLSYVRLNNSATLNDGDDFTDIERVTNWPHDNLRLIELAFESGRGRCLANNSQENKAASFQYGEPHECRLVAILKNIIKNNGTFKP